MSPSFPSSQWLHDTVVSVVTVGLGAFLAIWAATPQLDLDVVKAAWAGAYAAGARALIAILSGVLNGTASLIPHKVETETLT